MIRREYLVLRLFCNLSDLERKLEDFRQYYNIHHVHTSLGSDTPLVMPGETTLHLTTLSHFCWKSHCRGLYQLPVAA